MKRLALVLLIILSAVYAKEIPFSTEDRDRLNVGDFWRLVCPCGGFHRLSHMGQEKHYRGAESSAGKAWHTLIP